MRRQTEVIERAKTFVCLAITCLVIWTNGTANASMLPKLTVDIPDTIPAEVLYELASNHPNRGMRQQYALAFADRYPMDNRSIHLLFWAAADSVLKFNSYTDQQEKDYLWGDYDAILQLVIDRYPHTSHEITARFYMAMHPLNVTRPEELDRATIERAIQSFEALLQLANVSLTGIPERTIAGELEHYPYGSHEASLMNIAWCYELLHEWDLAAHTYRRVMTEFPNSELMIRAASKLYILRDLHGIPLDEPSSIP